MNRLLWLCAGLLPLLLCSSRLTACESDIAKQGILPLTFHTGQGPFLPPPECFAGAGSDLTDGGKCQGQHLIIEGTLRTPERALVTDADLYIWQTDHQGFYWRHVSMGLPADPHFKYLGKSATDAGGRYLFTTIKPIPYPGRSSHVHIAVVRDNTVRLFTEVHFAGAADLSQEQVFDFSQEDAKALIRTAVERPSPFGGRPILYVSFDIVIP